MLRDLATPSDFAGDPLGWAGNVAGHALLVGPLLTLPGAVAGLGLWSLALAAAVYAVWEAWHLSRGATLHDCVEDWLTVMLGAAMVWHGWAGGPVAFAVGWAGLVIAAGIGVARRARG